MSDHFWELSMRLKEAIEGEEEDALCLAMADLNAYMAEEVPELTTAKWVTYWTERGKRA